ncbi:hypothetical protein ACO0QE_002425 [Hanseniaspora vineae]
MSLSFENLQYRLQRARDETRQLYDQLDVIKNKNEDANLLGMSRTVHSLLGNNQAGNISSISASSKNSVASANNMENIRVLRGHHNKIADVKWSRDSQNIISASQDGYMIVWDPATGFKKNAVVLDSQWVLACAISPSSRLVASAGLNNHCTVYKIDDTSMVQQKTVSIFKGHTCYISECEFQDDTSIITVSGDMTACLWDIPKSMKKADFSEHLGDVLALALPKSGPHTETTFATAGSDGYVLVWDSRQRNSVQKFLVGDTDIGSLQFFSDGNSIASGSDDGVVRLFDLRADCKIADYSLVNRFQTLNKYHLQPSTEYRLTPHSEQSPFGSTAQQYNDSASIRTKDSTFDTSGVVSFDFSMSGRLMYVAYSNYGCVIWDTLKGEVVGTLEGHSNRVTKVKCSPNGFGLLTGSWDETIKLWTPSYS